MRNEISESERTKPRGVAYRAVVALFASIFMIGLAACSDLPDVIDAFEYIGATGDVLEANGMDGDSALELDCDGNEEAKTVTCTGETSGGQTVESRGENFGEDTATLVVTVDGELLYDGLLKDAPGS